MASGSEEQNKHYHDYWSGMAYVQEVHPVHDMVIGVNKSTLYTILNVHCFDFTVFFVCFLLVSSMFCKLLFVAQLCTRYKQAWSRASCQGSKCLSDKGGPSELGPSLICGIKVVIQKPFHRVSLELLTFVTLLQIGTACFKIV